MAFTNKDGFRYDSGFDPIVNYLTRVATANPDWRQPAVAAVRAMLAARPKEELPDSPGVRHARRRIMGSISDLLVLRSAALARDGLFDMSLLIDEVLVEAQKAFDAAPDFDRESKPAPRGEQSQTDPVADWVPRQLGGPARPSDGAEVHPFISIADLEID